MEETCIYLIRHAEAEGNLYRRFHGHYDSDVTANGERQIEALGERFLSVPVDAVYSSDLTRAKKTAQAIAVPKGLELRVDERLREIRMGEWEDRPFGEFYRFHFAEMTRFNAEPMKWQPPPGAESCREVTARLRTVLEELAGKHSGQSIAVVSHGTALNWVMRGLFPGSPSVHSDNTAVSRLRYDGAWHLDFEADNSHLSEEISTLAKQLWWRGGGLRDQNLWYCPYEDEIDRYLELCDDSVPVAPMAIIQFAMLDDKAIGLLQLDPQRGREEGAGVIDDLRLLPEYRGKNLGIQILGSAVSYYRAQGRRTLRVYLAGERLSAKPFFLSAGFREREAGMLEKDIRVVMK